MKCPYCHGDMIEGIIKCRDEIAWLQQKAKGQWMHPRVIPLTETTFFKRASVTAHCCEKCKKIVIDYR